MSSGKNLNIADYFSIYRLVAVPALLLAIVYERKVLTGSLLMVSFLTDAIDGYIARKKHIETPRGAKLDSIGDLITLIIGIAAFIVFETKYFLNHLPVVIVAIGLFVLQMFVALIRFRKLTSFHTYLAKITAVFMAVFLVITPIAGPVDILFYATFYLGILEAMEEIAITFILHKPEENVKGLYWILRRPDLKYKNLKST